MTAKAAKEMHAAHPGQKRTSLIPDALLDLEESGATIAAEAMAPSEEVDRRAKALAAVGAPPFRRFLKEAGIKEFERAVCETLQVSIGLYCNQACTHCHVESSPLRTEMMPEDVVNRCLHLLRTSPNVNTLDITGGAPELNSGFRPLVEGAAKLRDTGIRPGLRIIDRCNLTVLLEPGQEDLLDFLVQHQVDIIASLPSYDAEQTDRQRGRKVFERSVEALQMLNARGYGHGGANAKDGLRLDLVFNPPGPFLPPKQELLEVKYRQELSTERKIEFNQLITIANMPVKRFFDFLRKKGTLEGYMDLLVRNFNAETVPLVMCRNHVNVGWDGRLYDCDFNQQLELALGRPGLTVFDVDSLDDERLRRAPIATAAHCFGCTAAQGSS
uniref:Radical SAM core domain-containing protein n=1 Tax=Pyrodinium bahamense TaxID=73915 RepID=A0A7S0B719_9DINO